MVEKGNTSLKPETKGQWVGGKAMSKGVSWDLADICCPSFFAG